MSKKVKLLLWVLAVPLLFFVITFGIYFLNLDMKLLSKIEPLLLKHYDKIPRNVRI